VAPYLSNSKSPFENLVDVGYSAILYAFDVGVFDKVVHVSGVLAQVHCLVSRERLQAMKVLMARWNWQCISSRVVVERRTRLS